MTSRTYGPLSSSLRAPSPTPRRAFSLPAIGSYITGYASSSHILPLSSLPGSPGGRTAKRLSITLRNRANHNKVRLILGSILLTAILFFLNSSSRSNSVTRRFRTRDNQMVIGGSKKYTGGVTVMDVEDTDEWLAEDDLFYSQYTEDTPLSAEDAAAEAEMASREADVVEQNRQQSLRALTWWLAEGGEIPQDWEVPSKAYLKKIGGRGVERLLEDIVDEDFGDEVMFEDGWADFAKKRYRLIVFSKTHCPYSKRAKQILSQYHLSPAPFIVELDVRSDTAQLQDLLHHLTGRRTVPNILLDFVSIGGSDDLTLMHSEGGLQRRFEEMGVVPSRNKVFKPAEPVVEVVKAAEEKVKAAGGKVVEAAVKAEKVVKAAGEKAVEEVVKVKAAGQKGADRFPKVAKVAEKVVRPIVEKVKPVVEKVKPIAAKVVEPVIAAIEEIETESEPTPEEEEEEEAEETTTETQPLEITEIVETQPEPIPEPEIVEEEEEADDFEDYEGEEDTPLGPGATPEDIKLAVQAAHGDSYLLSALTDETFMSSQEFTNDPFILPHRENARPAVDADGNTLPPGTEAGEVKDIPKQVIARPIREQKKGGAPVKQVIARPIREQKKGAPVARPIPKAKAPKGNPAPIVNPNKPKRKPKAKVNARAPEAPILNDGQPAHPWQRMEPLLERTNAKKAGMQVLGESAEIPEEIVEEVKVVPQVQVKKAGGRRKAKVV